MLAVCQPMATAARFHLSLDAFLLRSICMAFPDEPVVYLSDRVSLGLMKKFMKSWPQNLTLKTAGVPVNGARRLHLHARLFINLLSCRRTASRLGVRALLYLAFATEVCSLHLVRPSSIPEYYIVHYNFHKSRRTPWGRSLLKWIGSRATALIFLEQQISRAALLECALDPRRVAVIPHPPVGLDPNVDKYREEDRRGIVMAGALTKEKGIQILLDGARILKTQKPEILVRLPIRVVGPYISGPNPQLYSDCVEYINQPLTDSELEQAMRSSRFVILPFDFKSYAYVTPGTFYRALSCDTPIISTDLPSLKDLTHGSMPIGFTFSDLPQFVEIMTRISNMTEQEHAQLRNNVRHVVQSRSLLATAQVVRQILRKR